jgi:CHAT domain-containing protein/tetratricopeptide (TPR) repeat protein
MWKFAQLLAVLFSCLWASSIFLSPSSAVAQDRSTTDPTIPAEMTPSDPDIRTLLGIDSQSCKPDLAVWAEKLQKALEIVESRGLTGDKALLEAWVASVALAQGNTDQSFLLYRKALEDSIAANRRVLTADILISLSSESQMKGDTQETTRLLTEALSLSERNGDLYGKARALGELSKLKLSAGKNDDAASLLEQALDIDRLNGYKFEALHLFYKGSYQGFVGDEDGAIETLAEARAKSVAAKDTLTFVQAENAYAFALVRKGKTDEALRQMEMFERMEFEEFIPDAAVRTCLQSYLKLPIARLVWLEGFANVLEAANQKEREIKVWNEVFSTSQEIGLPAGQAEAKEKVANLESQLKKTEDALQDYRSAADLYRKQGSDAFVDRVEISEAVLLVNLGRGKEALPIVEEIVSYAKRLKLRQLEFRAYITLSGIYQSSGELDKARSALETATALVHPGPFDEELDNKTVHLAYVSLSDVYRKLAIPTKELTSIDQAFFVSFHLKDDAAQKQEVNYLDQRIKELRVRELVEQKQKEGQLTESLIYSYILHIRDVTPTKPDDEENWQRILTLPFQITQKPEGPTELAGILKDLGPIQGLEKLPLLNAMARYYIGPGADPRLAERYALEAQNLLDGMQGDQTVLKVESTCQLALSYARQGKNALAETKRVECLSFAGKTQNEQTVVYADAVDGMVQAQTGNLAATKKSLERLISKSPNDPELLVELALSLASAKLYDEANSQLGSAVHKILSSGDKKTAAGAYARASFVLSTDSSETAKKLQLEYLNAALKLYRELGAKNEEGQGLLALGDYFFKLLQYKTAIDEYTKAKQLAERSNQTTILAQSVFGLGNTYQAQKDFGKASEFHEEAAKRFHELGFSVGETNSLRNLGSDYYQQNNPEKALPALLEARKVANSAGPLFAYLAAYFLGDFYNSQGQYEKGLASFRDAAEITAKADDTEHSAYSHLAISGVVGFLGAWEDSVTEAETALALFEKIGNKEGQAACWAHLTSIYSDRTSSIKDFDKAQECYRKALELGYGKTLDLDLMEIYLQTGKYGQAAKVAREAGQNCLKEKDPSCQAHALISLSEAERLDGNLKASRSALDEARPLVEKSPDLYLKGRLQYQGSGLLAAEGKTAEALASYRQLIALIETIKGRLATQDQRSIAENYNFIYDELVSLLYTMSKKSPAKGAAFASSALEYAEKNKARQFAESWGRVFKSQMAVSLPPSVREREQLLYSERDHIATKLAEASDSPNASERAGVANLNSDLARVQSQIQLFLKELRTVSPQYAAIAYPEDIAISNLPLHRGETLVEFKVSENSTFVWIVRNPDGKENQLERFYELPIKRTWLVDQVSRVRAELNSAHPEAIDLKICEQLFASLFPDDAGNILQDSSELILIPDDALFVLPFEMYSPQASKGNFPLLKMPTTYYPSAVSLRLARTARLHSTWQESFLGLADPITSPSDPRFELVKLRISPGKTAPPKGPSPVEQAQAIAPNPERLQSRGFSFERLPGTAEEVQHIATLLKDKNQQVDVRVGVDATKAKLLDTDLSKFRFLHFATHGVLAVDTGVQEPTLVLSSDGVDSSHMFLSMSEILGLKLQPESVVLSACNTGSGKITRAEGVMSLGRAFLAAGAESVTVSLWQVSDESTALLMEKYYKAILENKKKSEALATARYAVFKSGSTSPFFWAPFIIIGE